MDVLALANATVSIQTVATSTDHGHPTRKYRTAYAGIPCYFEQASAAEAFLAGGERQTRNGVCWFDGAQTVNPTDRILHGSRTLEVRTVNHVPDELGTARLRVEWEEVAGAS
jgi:head-tail adaptor